MTSNEFLSSVLEVFSTSFSGVSISFTFEVLALVSFTFEVLALVSLAFEVLALVSLAFEVLALVSLAFEVFLVSLAFALVSFSF